MILKEKRCLEDRRCVSVCLVSTAHNATDPRIFYKEASSLAAAGYAVTVIAQHEQDETIDGVRIVALPRPRSRIARMVMSTARVFAVSWRERADIYHIHDPELLFVGLLLRLLRRARVIYDVHEEYHQTLRSEREWVPPYLRRPLAGTFRVCEWLLARSLNHIIAATEPIGALFPPSKTTVVRNYPVLALSRPRAHPRVTQKEQYTLVYAGGLDEVRGVRQLIESLPLLSPRHGVRLTLLGWFSDPTFEQSVRSLPGFSLVDYRGHVRHDDVYSFLSEADIGLYCPLPTPRADASLPLKFLEYMAAGLPIVVADFPSWKALVGSARCGVTVDPTQPEEIARGVESLLDHPEERRRMGENGQRAVLECYNWEVEAKALLSLYEQILGEGR